MGKLKYMIKKQPLAILYSLGAACGMALVYALPPTTGPFYIKIAAGITLGIYIGANCAFLGDFEIKEKQGELEKKVE